MMNHTFIVQYAAKSSSPVNPDESFTVERWFNFNFFCKSDEEDSDGSDSDQSTSLKGTYNQELLYCINI